jgi:transcriptional regulator with XRE-family HTH domain
MSDSDEPALGPLLRTQRTAAHLTIEALAARSEVSPRAISDLERGRVQRPQRRTLDALLDALGFDGPERQVVIEAARGGARSAPADSPEWCRLPSPAEGFIGRDPILRALTRTADRAVVSSGPAAVELLTGPPGVGKTALAVRAATDLASRFPGGAQFIDLRGTGKSPLSPAEALPLLLRALGVAGRWIPRDVDEMAGNYRALLRERPALVVLDDVADEAQVRPLLPGDGRSLVLLTSRRQLGGLVEIQRRTVART